MTWLWIIFGYLFIAIFLWGVCAGSSRNRKDEDLYQIAAIEAWQAKQAEKAKRQE